MKKIYLFQCLILLMGVNFSFAQPQDKTTIRAQYKVVFDQYCVTTDKSEKKFKSKGEDYKSQKIAAGWYAFNEQFKEIMTTVIVGSNDVVNSGNAFSYTYDKNKKTLSVNGVYLRRETFVLDAGISLKDEDEGLDFYSKGAWQKDIGLKLGVAFPLKFKQLYMKDSCDIMRHKRAKYVGERLAHFDSIYDNKALMDKYVADFKTKHIDEKTLLSTVAFDNYTAIDTILKKYKRIVKALAEIEMLTKLTKDALRDSLEMDVSKSDLKNKIFHGYSLSWLSLNSSYVNSSIKFTNDNIINEDYQKKYNSFSKFTIEANFNYHRLGLKTIQYLNAFGRLSRGSFIDLPSLKGKTYSLAEVGSGDATYYNVLADDIIVQRYDNLKNPLMYMEAGSSYTNIFWKKIVGLNLRANLAFPFKSEVASYERNYTIMGGLIARLNQKDKWAVTTIMLNGGVESEMFETQAWKNFVLKASVSIPFTIFEPKKTK